MKQLPVALILVFLMTVSVQPVCAVSRIADKVSPSMYEVRKVSITIEGNIPEEVIRQVIQTEESPLGLWTYLYLHVYEKIGAKPSYFDPILFDGDVIRIRRFMEDQGFFKATVDTSIRFDRDRGKVDLSIHVIEGQRSRLDTIHIYGLDQVIEEAKKEISENSLVKVGDPYLKEVIEQERLRILRILQNSGYTYAGLDSVVASRYLSTNNFSLALGFHVGRRYVFGPVDISLDRGKIESEIILRQIDVIPGNIYSEEKKIDSEQNLNRLGLFEQAKLESLTPNDTSEPPYIPIHIVLRARDLHELTPELLVDNEDETFNTGFGIGYSNRNFFGEARNFSTRARFRLHSIDNLNLSSAFQNGFSEPTLLAKTDLQMQLVQPYFFSNRLSASLTVSGEFEKQRYYGLNTLRNRIGFTNKFATFTLGFVDWYLERVAVDIKDTLRVSPALFTGTRQKQFNSILTLTLQRDKTNDVFSPSGGFFHSGSLEEAGAIPRMFGELGGGLPFAEYIKGTFMLRHYFSGDGKGVIWAFKLRGGAAFLYNSNNRTPVPPTRKFYAGGGMSVRGWKSRSLAVSQYPDQGGNVGVEGSSESRIHLFAAPKKLWFFNLENLWAVLFVDFGNVWDSIPQLQTRQIAIATGMGLRYETFVGPLRFDIGFRVYDPDEADGRRWIYQRKLFYDTFSVIHFGIGQAF